MAGYGRNGKSEHGMKGVFVKPINANEADYERFEILGHDALFTCLRIDRKSLPEGFTHTTCATVMIVPVILVRLKVMSW